MAKEAAMQVERRSRGLFIGSAFGHTKLSDRARKTKPAGCGSGSEQSGKQDLLQLMPPLKSVNLMGDVGHAKPG